MTGNHCGLISSLSAASPDQSALVKIATSMFQDGCAGNRKVSWAASVSASWLTRMPDSSLTSRAAAAAREVKEESGIRVAEDALTEAAQLTFLFPERPSWDMDVAIFTSADFSGEATESEEIRPQWFPVTALPLDRMWDDGKHWLPRVLAGERLRATFSYAPDNETVAAATITPLP